MGLVAQTIVFSLLGCLCVPTLAQRMPVPNEGACDWGLVDAGVEASCFNCRLYYDGRPGYGDDANGRCVYNPADGVCFAASWATSQGMFVHASDCVAVSGDPVATINGRRIKFDLPVLKDSLLWQTNNFQLLARADLQTPDKQSQWFSSFSFWRHEVKLAQIERKEITAAATSKAENLNTILVKIAGVDGQQLQNVNAPGEYDVGDGSAKVVVERKGDMLDHVFKETVTVESNGMKFEVVPQLAIKFKNIEMARKYVHLDINMKKMTSDVTGGIFAELWGLVPMSLSTARSIRSLKIDQ